MMVRLRLFVVLLVVSTGPSCTDRPDVEGEWEGVTTSATGSGFYYKIVLSEAEGDAVTGVGGISVYTREDTAADSTLRLDVRGTFRAPTLALTITGPFPTASRQVSADFQGTLSADGDEIEGILSSPVTGEVELDLKRVERE